MHRNKCIVSRLDKSYSKTADIYNYAVPSIYTIDQYHHYRQRQISPDKSNIRNLKKNQQQLMSCGIVTASCRASFSFRILYAIKTSCNRKRYLPKMMCTLCLLCSTLCLLWFHQQKISQKKNQTNQMKKVEKRLLLFNTKFIAYSTRTQILNAHLLPK